MPSDVEREALRDIATNIRFAIEFLGGATAGALEEDLRTLYAVVRCLEIVSEASRRLSSPTIERHPEIAWVDVRAAGNVYRHEYGKVVPRRVVYTVRESLPPLLAAVEAELARLA